ncbi:MAG: hypothetical protein ACT4O2_11610 [Beijerinckiaceae bacterium]
MQLQTIFALLERLRVEAIGTPQFDPATRAYTYEEKSARVVAILKLMRAAQGVSAINVLCQAGLFIDFGVGIRCIRDCIEEIYFLLEEYPTTSSNVAKFVKVFFESKMTMDGHTSPTTPAVERSKIRSAMVRYLKDAHDDAIQQLMKRNYKTFSGYVHANNGQIMETFGGPSRSFNLAGIRSTEETQKRMEYVGLQSEAVMHAAAFIAHKLGLDAIYHALRQEIVRTAQT